MNDNINMDITTARSVTTIYMTTNKDGRRTFV